MTNMRDIKALCDAFDETFELEGGEHKRYVDTLLPALEAAYADCPKYADWLVYMYGMLASNKGNDAILTRYKEIKDEKNEHLKRVSAERKVFDMYSIITLK